LNKENNGTKQSIIYREEEEELRFNEVVRIVHNKSVKSVDLMR
jgi:hypothetical protein